MSNGKRLGIDLLKRLAVWGWLDLEAWINGEETFSQWIIKHSKLSLLFAVTTLLIVILFSSWLIVHWELPAIILEHINIKAM